MKWKQRHNNGTESSIRLCNGEIGVGGCRIKLVEEINPADLVLEPEDRDLMRKQRVYLVIECNIM